MIKIETLHNCIWHFIAAQLVIYAFTPNHWPQHITADQQAGNTVIETCRNIYRQKTDEPVS